MQLLARELLSETGRTDRAAWNFSLSLGYLQRKRFSLVLSMISGQHFDRLLEIGYGCGIFMPELQHYCRELYGVDIHRFDQQVSAKLELQGVSASLFSADVCAMPFEEQFFDCAIAVSSLEYTDADLSGAEIRRVLKPGGVLVLVTPGYSPLIDWGLRVLTGTRALEEYGDRRQRLLPALEKQFRLEKRKTFPPIRSSLLILYRAVLCRKTEPVNPVRPGQGP